MFLQQSPAEIGNKYIVGCTPSDVLKKQVLCYLQKSFGSHSSNTIVSILKFKRFLKSFRWIMEKKVSVFETNTRSRKYVYFYVV